MNERAIALRLSREQAGTLLGALAWVMGALQIMRDRGHAEEDAELQELHDLLLPRLEALVEQLSASRQATGTTPQLEAELEAAYSDVRGAFETWIHLTAVDTLSAAVAERLERERGEGSSSEG
jgi:hypothetical protein